MLLWKAVPYVDNSFLLYKETYIQYCRLKEKDPALAQEYIQAVLAFGFEGKMPPKDNAVWLYGLDQFFKVTSIAKSRYQASVENGKKGGRPSISLDIAEINQKKKELGTWKKVAEYYQISEDTLRKIRKTQKPKQTESQDLDENAKNGFSGFSAGDKQNFAEVQSKSSEKPKNLNIIENRFLGFSGSSNPQTTKPISFSGSSNPKNYDPSFLDEEEFVF